MIWTIIGVGFLGADKSHHDEPLCMPSYDPVYSLAFKIIVLHASMIGFYFMPYSSLILARILPSSLSSGLSRTATKPMIDKLGSIPMTEGMFAADPEEATCAICLGDYAPDETIRILPCQHHFHLECVDQWLITDKSCPLCKHDIDKPVHSDRINSSRFQTVPPNNPRGSENDNAFAAATGDVHHHHRHHSFQVIIT
ncbi:hypothetical protein EDD11_003767 [Mortierella claussenii]|nr:hypothetical protein EDD11_003767 [Mortierella claussenii]